KNAVRRSRCSSVSLLGGEEAIFSPTAQEKLPLLAPPAEVATDQLPVAQDFFEREIFPHLGKSRLAQNATLPLRTDRRIGMAEPLSQLGIRDLDIPQEIRPVAHRFDLTRSARAAPIGDRRGMCAGQNDDIRLERCP